MQPLPSQLRPYHHLVKSLIDGLLVCQQPMAIGIGRWRSTKVLPLSHVEMTNANLLLNINEQPVWCDCSIARKLLPSRQQTIRGKRVLIGHFHAGSEAPIVSLFKVCNREEFSNGNHNGIVWNVDERYSFKVNVVRNDEIAQLLEQSIDEALTRFRQAGFRLDPEWLKYLKQASEHTREVYADNFIRLVYWAYQHTAAKLNQEDADAAWGDLIHVAKSLVVLTPIVLI